VIVVVELAAGNATCSTVTLLAQDDVYRGIYTNALMATRSNGKGRELVGRRESRRVRMLEQ
jgi:hypothetical protein